MKVLLLDAAFAAEPLYNALVGAGHEVWVMGSRQSDLLATKAGVRWINQDYSDVDAVRHQLGALNIDRLIPGCTDVSLETCVEIGLPWFLGDSREVNALLSEKSQFRALCSKLGLPAPRAHGEQEFPREGMYICKPVDSFSGKGISIFNGRDSQALEKAVGESKSASRGGRFVIEEFCSGHLHSCSAFIADGKVTCAFYVREGSSVNPYAVDTSYVVFDLPVSVKVRIESSLELLAEHLKLSDGLIHVQFILDSTDPYIVEVTRRCPGDLYSLLIEHSTGFAYARKFVGAFLKDSISDDFFSHKRYVLRHTVTSQDGGVYVGVNFYTSLPVLQFVPLQSVGAFLLPRQANRAGILFVDYVNEPAVKEAFDVFLQRKAYSVT